MVSAQHSSSSGFGNRSTAAEVVAGIDLAGRTAIVTGGYLGLGLETVRALVGAGADVVVPARRPEHARSVLADLGPAVQVDALDLADLPLVAGNGARVIALSSTGHKLSAIRFDAFSDRVHSKWYNHAEGTETRGPDSTPTRAAYQACPAA